MHSNKKNKDIKLITAGNVYGKKSNKKAWTTAIASDVLPLTEVQLSDVKKHDIIDVGHRDEVANEIQERQLDKDFSNKREGEKLEISERQLRDMWVGEPEMITEVQLNQAETPNVGARREETWEGDDIKIYRDINWRQKENAAANDEFYKSNKDRTTGEKGTISAKSKKNIK